MGIVTKTGDDGHTQIITGERLPKDHPAIECLGTLDELNAFLGDAKAAIANTAAANSGDSSAADIITQIQKDLFTLMGVIAGTPIPPDGIGEERLDALIAKLESAGLPMRPPISSFAVPGENPVSAKLHIARTVCRRAERHVVALARVKKTEVAVMRYINRLSDVLFLLG